MRFHQFFVALSLIAALSACTAGQDKSPDTKPVPERAPAKDPMASFARLVSGEWRLTSQSGKSMFHTWHWGPGKHSIRRMTDGSGASGEPWRALMVMYWHPSRKQVRLLGVEPVARGVAEGTINFEGDTADGVFDLYQTGGRRKMGLRWAFDGPDKYHDTLLEATGPDGLKPLVEFDHVRSEPPATPRPRTVEGAPKPSERLKALEPLLGSTWEAKGQWAAGDAFHVRTTFEWVPLADASYARVLAPSKEGETSHVLDTYVYHHTGANVLRCLALSNRGGVYEGDLTVLDGGGSGALQLDLKGYEGDRVVSHVVRFDFENDGSLRHRVWFLKGTERTLMLDVPHKSLSERRSNPNVPEHERSARAFVGAVDGGGASRTSLENQPWATKSVTAKLRLRLELIAALPEPIMLDRLRRLSVADLIVFRRMYGIQECRCKARCKIQHFMLRATSTVKLADHAASPLACSVSCAMIQRACTRPTVSVPHVGRRPRPFHSRCTNSWRSGLCRKERRRRGCRGLGQSQAWTPQLGRLEDLL
jgi:hypothetical protein